jgi:hypothetical protein
MNKQTVVKWSGWTMTNKHCSRPKQYIEPLISFVSGEYHWERKNMLRSYAEQFPSLKYTISKYIPLFSELCYGWEFTRFDSFWSLDNGGLSPCAPYTDGYTKSFKVQRLRTPRDTIVDNMLYSTPFYVEWKRADAKEFSIRRKALWRETPNIDAAIFEYSNPRLEQLKTKKINFGITQKCISDWYDLRLIVSEGYSLGKVTCNLFGDELFKAIHQCSRASNPFESFSTGGYRVLTKWRAPPVVSLELWQLCESFASNISLVKHHLTSRLDPEEFLFEGTYKRDLSKRKASISTKSLEETQSETTSGEPRSFKYIKFSPNMLVELPEKRETLPQNAVNILGDLSARVDDTAEDPYIFIEDEDEIDPDIYGDLVYED